MGKAIIILITFSARGFAADPGSALPLFFFPSAAGFRLETPELSAVFGADSVIFRAGNRNLMLKFRNSNPDVAIEGAEPLAGQANFFMGNQVQNWKPGVATYDKILYRGLYPGVDMTYASVGRRIKSVFTVAPGADPVQIELEYPEADSVSIAENGDLVVKSGAAELREESPIIYQESGGQRLPIEGHYRILDAHTVGFEIGAYDVAIPLVIDPVISYSTYLGGGSTGGVTGLAVDASGNLYITGWTQAHDFPIAGAIQAANQGGVDAFVVKLNPTGTALIYATYIGGQGDDRAAGIAVDSSGQAYVTGSTSSANFPMSSPIRSKLGGSRTAFAFKLNAAGNSLLYSTYLGGSNYDLGNAIAVDGSGNAYIAGDTYSTDFSVLRAVQGSLGGLADAFVTKLTSSGTISFSTYLGGAGNDHAGGIAVDLSGNVYVAGGTFSKNFPTLGAIQATNGGGQDAFVTKISSSGSAIVYSTYLGGAGGNLVAAEQANAIAVDSSGSAYVTGVTNSVNFPVSAGVVQASLKGVSDAFVTKLNASGNTRVYSTYLGGSSFDWVSGIAVDSIGNAYVAGYTLSSDFPTVGGVQTNSNGMYDAFVSKLNAGGSALSFSTFYGGTGSDTANAIAIDAAGSIYSGGQTNSFDMSLQTPVQSANNGGSTGWVMRLGSVVVLPQPPQAISVSPAAGSGGSQTFTFVYSDPAGASDLTSVLALFNTAINVAGACFVSVDPIHGSLSLENDDASIWLGPIALGTPTTLQNSQCVVRGVGSGVASTGDTLTLNLAVTFLPAFSGAKNTYGFAQTVGGLNSGWQSLGTWVVSGPRAVSVTPSSGSGATQTFSFVYTDLNGLSDLASVQAVFNATLNWTSACYVAVNPVNGTAQLANDANTAFLGPITLGSSATLQNSQCTLAASGSNLVSLGTNMTLKLALTFAPAFAGVKGIYGFARTTFGQETGWPSLGTWTALATSSPPQAVSVAPASGSGSSQNFTLVYSDPNGASDLVSVQALFNTIVAPTGTCWVLVDPGKSLAFLANDGYTGFAGPIILGSSAILQNSQCTIDGANSSVKSSGNIATVNLGVTFPAGYGGAKNVYGFAQSASGITSGWQLLGSWTVIPQRPQAGPVTPSLGTGSAQAFSMVYSDPNGASDLVSVQTLFNTAVGPFGTCWVLVDPGHSLAFLANDEYTGYAGPITLGSSAILQNSQCTINGANSSVKSAGDTVIVNLAVTFSAGFAGAKNIYGYAQAAGGLNSGWQKVGAWTVP